MDAMMPLVSHAPRPQMKSVVFAGGEEGRDRVHVGGKSDDGGATELRKDVEAVRLDGNFFDQYSVGGTIEYGGESGEMVVEEHPDAFLVRSHGLNVDQRSCQLENIHRRIHGSW